MTSLRRAEDERQLVRLSYYDTLTGFYNRNRYIRDINRQAQADGSFGIAYLDVNGLKDINDYYGHDYGDQVLASCAQKIRDAFPTGDFYRIGGDEFVVLCRGLEEEAFLSVVKKLRGLFAAGGVCHAAVGCQWTEKTANIQQLITAADTMMYEDKKHFYRRNSQSNRYRHYNDDVLGLTVPGVLPKLLEEERFVIYFQPKKAFHDRTLIGAEALVRYRTPGGRCDSAGSISAAAGGIPADPSGGLLCIRSLLRKNRRLERARENAGAAVGEFFPVYPGGARPARQADRLLRRLRSASGIAGNRDYG